MAKVLIVDDDMNVRSMLETALRAAGHSVATAREGAEALRSHASNPVELIITDIFMPGMEGLETIRTLRRDDKVVKILAISGVNMGNPLGMAMCLGANRTLEKPFHPHELLATVNDVLIAKP